jgi:hypothetical protein
MESQRLARKMQPSRFSEITYGNIVNTPARVDGGKTWKLDIPYGNLDIPYGVDDEW